MLDVSFASSSEVWKSITQAVTIYWQGHLLFAPRSLKVRVRRDQKKDRCMNKLIRTSLSTTILLVLSACNLFGPAPVTGDTPVVLLTVQTANGATTFNAVGEIINYNYIVTNTGSSQLAGPVTVADLPRTVTCPGLDTIGDNDNFLDPAEMITCTSSYSITEADANTGSVTNLAIANAGGQPSNPSGVTLLRAGPTSTPQPSAVLTLSITANPQTYSQAAQPITLNYAITNTGTTPLGPDQFMITDNIIGAAFPCGPAATTIAPNQPLNCTVTYTTTLADLGAGNVTNSARASGAGQISAAATTTITNFTITQTAAAITLTPAPGLNLSPGSTIQHQVAVGEWLIQIGRCYGAAFDELRNANPQIANPDFILPSMMVTVPRIGSVGKIYRLEGPCITFHTVQSGDTWASLAQRYNADLAVLQKVNPSGLVVGTAAKIPLNSAGATGVTAVPVTATGTVPTTIAAQRITIPAGQTSISVAGAISPGQPVQYVLAATTGQLLSISLTGPLNTEATLGVNGPTGLALKSPDGSFSWNTTITTGGDHFINIASLTGSPSKAYSLTVSLTSATTPATPTFTATATATPTGTATATNTPP